MISRHLKPLLLCALPLALPATSQAQLPAAIAEAVAESGDYQLIYQVAIPALNEWGGSANNINYTVDNSGSGMEFDRVAYVMEVDSEWVWVSFDAVFSSLAEIGVPVLALHPEPVQQVVEDMSVFSNVNDEGRIQTGTGLTGGNIEFWSGNYGAGNALGIPNASDADWDFGDTMVAGSYACMQVHNHAASQVLFALNGWGGGTGNSMDLGIGSNPAGQPDWTFAANSANYTVRNFYALVREGAPPNLSIPNLLTAHGSLDLTRIALEFDEPLAESSAAVANFSIAGLTVAAAELRDHIIILTTSAQTAGASYTVSYTGISDLEGNTLTQTKTIDFAAVTAPTFPGTIPEASDYELIYAVNIPSTAPAWGNGVPYLVDESLFSETTTFDRVGYILELQYGAPEPEWVFVSYNTIRAASQLSEIGIPTTRTSAPFQTKVTGMDVFSNVPTITTGTGLSGGNIEFWPSNYSQPNTAGIPNADDASFDWGDGGANNSVGYGSMQIHNHAAGEVIFGFNRWGGGGGITDIGIGTNPLGGEPDYTFAGNGEQNTLMSLYVVVRPVQDTDGDGIPDTLEVIHGLNPNVADSDTDKDEDGLTALVEVMELETDPNNPDTDGDLLRDGVESNSGTYVSSTDTGTSPLLEDTDGDGLLDSAEVPGGDPGTSPVRFDTDGDFVSDGKEVANGSDPLDPNSKPAFAVVPAAIASAVSESGDYTLAYRVAVPGLNEWAGDLSNIDYDVNAGTSGIQFDRVAYILELDSEWVWVSFDTFSPAINEVAVPVISIHPKPVQRLVQNMNVFSNVNDDQRLQTGTGLTGGNIEFWGGNYAPGNQLEIPNADSNAFDFGDTMAGGGHGCMQVHNHGASQVVFAFNNWGSNNPGTSQSFGIGTNPDLAGSPDWTFGFNGPNLTTRNLYVLVRQLASAPELSVGLAGGQITLYWEGGGTLQTAPSITGPWTNVDGAVTGYAAPANDAAAFFRVQ